MQTYKSFEKWFRMKYECEPSRTLDRVAWEAYQAGREEAATKGKDMTRLGKFVTPEELEAVNVQLACSGMFLSGGRPMGDPAWEVEQLRKKYGMPKGTGLDPSNGEFVMPLAFKEGR